jgi:ATP-binding cassette subfamily F protein 3
LSPSNFIILDEPTNHLDIISKEVLKSALINYEGTFIVVSHDREFLDGLTNRIWDIEDKGLKIHHFGVQEFLERKMEINENSKNNISDKTNTNKVEIKVEKIFSIDEQKEIKRKKNHLNNKIKKTEENISLFEAEIKKMDELIINLDYTNEKESTKILAEYENMKTKLNQEMEIWEKTTEELMEIDN